MEQFYPYTSLAHKVLFIYIYIYIYKTKTKLHGLSPQANYTD
jgi:hypothetical protein